MKTLTIRQPWASLVVTPSLENPLKAIKDIENRTWKTSYRGPLLIHAASFKIKNWDNIPTTEDQNDVLRSYGAGVINYEITSAIIGKVDLVDCVINHDSIWAERTPFCPITGLKYFCDIEDEQGYITPTYGGPFDSYTIPYPDQTAKGEYVRSRFDHDCGCWKGEENVVKKTNIPTDRRPIYNWVLANSVLFDQPILNVKGKLSLWDYPNILAEPEEENGKLFCHCQIPVKEENQVSRFLGEEYRCKYCGGIWYK